MAFPLAPKPLSHLGYYRLLSPSAGIRVSPLALGSMNFGTAWEKFMGKCDKNTTFQLLDFFKSKGGNLIDTANFYQNEEAETWIGQWMADRKCRDQMVVTTKYTGCHRSYQDHSSIIQTNYGGNSAKSMKHALTESLAKLQTDYVDIFYVHWWTFDTPIEEVMHYLNDLVASGKVLYLGISDTPAWIVSKANAYARAHGLRPFIVYQGKWSAEDRSFEREIIPMCRADGMGLMPYGTLGGGSFKTQQQWKSEDRRSIRPPSESQLKISKALENIADAKGTQMTSVALAYILHKTPHVVPIVGGRSVKHLEQNIEALGLALTQDEMKAIDDAVPFDRGFPHNFTTPNVIHDEVRGPQDTAMIALYTYIDMVKPTQPIPAGVHERY